MTVKYIIGHWTAGNKKPSNYEKTCYQLLIDNLGNVHQGTPVGKTASTGGMNSITYNIACCGGADFSLLSCKQVEEFCLQVAKKLKEYKLSVNKFYTHAEIGEMVRNYLQKNLFDPDCDGKQITELLPWNSYLPQNKGKIDLKKLPDKIGNLITYRAGTSGKYLRKKSSGTIKDYKNIPSMLFILCLSNFLPISIGTFFNIQMYNYILLIS